ncbi:MAG TPA: single-stranded-DNA-specific exonuclease RecJ [Armatimonadota bacterium]|nr:single-stranded-DNA-specific exonuclease RecJ [Armatimonadota bacterium]
MSKVVWSLPEHDDALVNNLAEELGISETVARILVNRGVRTVSDAHAFMSPSLDQMHDPMLLPDMEAGVERVVRALEAKEKILIHGDYDVDGVSSTALLVRVFTKLGANVVHRIPHRKRDGYDIKPYTAEEAKAEGVSLIITADCGVTACETIEHAQTLGVDIIVTDHHEPGHELPKAIAIINPHRHDSTYPFSELAGVGVALKFAQAIVRRLGYDDQRFVERYLDLAALGTIADVMPLVDENRVIAKFGLEALAKSKKLGIQALLRKTGLDGKRLTPHSIGFVLGPRINAVGRLDDAAIALQLLVTGDESEADELVGTLERLNQERQTEQARILAEVQEILEQEDLDDTRALVLSKTGWHSGIVGIVASKVVELYNRPAILLSLDEETGTAHGSARSIEAFNIFAALNQCRDLLDRVGGHELAAGVSLKVDNIDQFQAKLNEVASQIIKPEDMIPRIMADAQIDPDAVTWKLMNEIRILEPFGPGNPEPLFISSDVETVESRRVGGDGSHLKMRVRGTKGLPVDCIAFGFGELEPAVQVGRKVDLCYNIRSNSYNGRNTVQLAIKDIRTEE